MAPKNKNKEVVEDQGDADNSKSLLTTIFKENREDHYNFEETVLWKVSTGSLTLDAATGGVIPGLWRICGASNSGKTPLVLEILRNFLENVERSKAVWLIAEGRGLTDENKARCGLKFVDNIEDWEYGTVLIVYSNVYELFIRTVKDLVKNNPAKNRYAFVVDSVDGLILRDDLAKDIEDANKVAGVPALSKKMLQSLSLGMFKFGHWMGMISQVTAEIKLDPYAKTPARAGNFSGGNAIQHAAAQTIELENANMGDFILSDANGKMTDGKTKPIGQEIRARFSKAAKEEYKRTTVKYPIRYGRKPSGVWVEREIVDMMITWRLVNRSGAWYNIEPALVQELKENGINIPEKCQGVDSVYEIFEKDEKAKKYMYNRFLKILTE